MHVTQRPLHSIRPYANNPRVNDAGVDAVAISIREFGFRQPIVVDEEGVIIVGHTRYKAALKLGLERVPVHVANGLTPAQVEGLPDCGQPDRHVGQWDEDRLTAELMALQETDVDLNVIGFSHEELLRLMDPPTLEGACDPDDVPEPPDEATTQPGDLWILASTGFSAAIAPSRPTWIGCSTARRSISSTPTRRTTSRSSRDPTTPSPPA